MKKIGSLIHTAWFERGTAYLKNCRSPNSVTANFWLLESLFKGRAEGILLSRTVEGILQGRTVSVLDGHSFLPLTVTGNSGNLVNTAFLQ